VPFATPLLLGVNDADRVVQSNDVQKPSTWFVSDGASTRRILLCNLDQDSEGRAAGRVRVRHARTHSGCVDGFRIKLDVDSSATIRAVEVAVRAP